MLKPARIALLLRYNRKQFEVSEMIILKIFLFIQLEIIALSIIKGIINIVYFGMIDNKLIIIEQN